MYGEREPPGCGAPAIVVPRRWIGWNAGGAAGFGGAIDHGTRTLVCGTGRPPPPPAFTEPEITGAGFGAGGSDFASDPNDAASFASAACCAGFAIYRARFVNGLAPRLKPGVFCGPAGCCVHEAGTNTPWF